DGDFRQIWSDLGVEPVAVHAEIGRRITVSYDPRGHSDPCPLCAAVRAWARHLAAKSGSPVTGATTFASKWHWASRDMAVNISPRSFVCPLSGKARALFKSKTPMRRQRRGEDFDRPAIPMASFQLSLPASRS